MLRRPALVLALLPALLFGCDVVSGDGGGVEDSAERLFPVQQDGKRALIDKTGRVAVDLGRYNRVLDGAEGLVPARYWDDGNVWDFYRADGTVAFSASVDDAYPPRQGRARVQIDGRWAFLDTDGRFVVNPYLADARDFSEGRARVRTTSGRWGMMDRGGVVVVEPAWGSLGPLRDNRARVKEGDAYGYVDRDGETAIEAGYDDARDFSDGRAAVRQGQRWFYVDAENRRLLGSQTFISAGDFSEGLAPGPHGEQVGVRRRGRPAPHRAPVRRGPRVPRRPRRRRRRRPVDVRAGGRVARPRARVRRGGRLRGRAGRGRRGRGGRVRRPGGRVRVVPARLTAPPGRGGSV